MTNLEKAIYNSACKDERVDALIREINHNPLLTEEGRHLLHLELAQFITCNMHKIKFKDDGTPTGGKIAGISSIDGNAMGCGFCQKMRELAEMFPELKLVCEFCYACGQQETFKTLVQMAHKRNVRILSEVEFTEEELATVNIPFDMARAFCRINEDGDTVNVIHARNIIRIMRTHPHIRFAWWYKNRSAVYSALDELGKPDNCEVVFSVPTVSASLERIRAMAGRYDDKVFAVFFTSEEVDEAVRNGFVRCNGVKCYTCGYRCYKRHDGGVLYIAEQMRK